MDINEEKAFFEFIEDSTEPFTLDEIISHIQKSDDQKSGQKKKDRRLVSEITAYLDLRRIAFKMNKKQWVSRRGCFEKIPFVITPTRLELLNGILIPGHRCIPFANPLIMPHNYKFFWKGGQVPETTTEAPPEDLYPFYCVYGEEFAPQYIARDNPENEEAYYADPFEDPPEVSIHTLDMRGIYRESAFVPGDRFKVNTMDWKEGCFNLEKVRKDDWTQADLKNWQEAAENGFEKSFNILGPGASTEEQLAYAYWLGSPRMKEIPACSLEEFLYEKTDNINTVPYGIETRFWFSGKEIPDIKELQNNTVPPDKTFIEDLLFDKNIPISEFVILAYIRDAFYRNEKFIDLVINRLVPPVIHLEEAEWDILADFISESMEEFYKDYSLFLDQSTGPVRQRVAELHTAVIELSARLQNGEFDSSWLPRHTFIILSQIQAHAASLLEELAFDDSLPNNEISAIDNSLDSMVETYTDIKDLIDTAMDNFRRSNLTVIHGGKTSGQIWRIIQISITGLDVWRRAVIANDCTMEELHRIIQIGMNWKNNLSYKFYYEASGGNKQYLDKKNMVSDIEFYGKKELIYEYGPKWTINILIMSSYQPAKDEIVRFVAGEGAAPPEAVNGPRQFGKILTAVETGSSFEKQAAMYELGTDFSPAPFDIEKCNKKLRAEISKEKEI